jgi:hypothetical protein
MKRPRAAAAGRLRDLRIGRGHVVVGYRKFRNNLVTNPALRTNFLVSDRVAGANAAADRTIEEDYGYAGRSERGAGANASGAIEAKIEPDELDDFAQVSTANRSQRRNA